MPLIKNIPAFAKCDTCGAQSPPCADVLKAEREAEARGWFISPLTEEVICPACWERRVRERERLRDDASDDRRDEPTG